LLASHTHGELWIGYEHAAGGPLGEPSRRETALRRRGPSPFATVEVGNGTLLQAAAGVLAGWSLLGSRPGIHSVDELDPDIYLSRVESILGPRRIVHAPAAIPRALPERRTPFRETSEHRQYNVRAMSVRPEKRDVVAVDGRRSVARQPPLRRDLRT
jgi:hypothetical protein